MGTDEIRHHPLPRHQPRARHGGRLEAHDRPRAADRLARRRRIFRAVDLIVLPGGFSFGDYLRSGAIAARSPDHAGGGEARAGRRARARRLQRVPDALRGGPPARRADAQRLAQIRLPRGEARSGEHADAFTRAYRPRQVIRCPVAHHDGNFFADQATLDRLEDGGPRRFPLCRGHQSERLAERYRRHPERGRQRARPDAASGGPDGPGAWRARRPAALPGPRRRLQEKAA